MEDEAKFREYRERADPNNKDQQSLLEARAACEHAAATPDAAAGPVPNRCRRVDATALGTRAGAEL